MSKRSFAFAAFALFALCARAENGTADFRSVKDAIKYEGASEIKWINKGESTEELILIYKTTGTSAVNTFTPLKNVEARVLVVGGGGAGGSVRSSDYTSHPGGGGGGAGELVEREGVSFSANGTCRIVVGAGGPANGVLGTASAGLNGDDTYVTLNDTEWVRVKGGGGGGGESVGASGGSGGGGSNSNVAGGSSSKAAADGKGNAGGSSHKRYAGGGGGAGAVGGNGVSGTAGVGGEGVYSDINPKDTEDEMYYAGGGGGGVTYSKRNGGAGGAGGGGSGGGSYDTDEKAPKPGTDGYGGGGGGGSIYRVGAKGGDGVVIIRVTFIEVPMVWKEIPVTVGSRTGTIYIDENAQHAWDNGDLVITYTETAQRGGLKVGSAEVPVWANARVLLVGGGGGGGLVNVRSTGGAGAGGGAGGFVERSGLVFDNSTEFSISVGSGGSGGTADGVDGVDGVSSTLKTNGHFVVDEALGGGGGGSRRVGHDGGSGGGGSMGATKEGGVYARTGGSGVDGQGFAGGSGIDNYKGGGGGGGGGVGGDGSNALGAGLGGLGRSSDITGETLWYAGGGGGAYIHGNDTTTTKHLGGAGGSGVGGDGAGVDGGASGTELNPIAATDGMDGRGGGGGGGTSHAGATTAAGKGGSGIVIIRLSGFVVQCVPIPTALGPFTYDGNAHTGVVEFYAYKLSGAPIAVNADTYTAIATLAPDAPYTWDDERGGRGDRTITWFIRPKPVLVPAEIGPFTYGNATRDGEETKTAVVAVDDEKRNGGVDGDGFCWTNGLKYCSLSKDTGTASRPNYDGYQGVHAGDYTFTATLCNDTTSQPNITNFVWLSSKDNSNLQPRQVEWTILQAENKIKTLTLASWQLDTSIATPVASWQWESVAKTYGDDKVCYQWGDTKVGPWYPDTPSSDFAAIAKDLPGPGRYYLKATICKDSQHEPGDWCEATKTTRFCVWQHPSTNLSDYVDITFSGNSVTTTLTDFPVLVRLKEGVRNADGAVTGGIPGFRYADVRDNGAGLRFLSIDASGDPQKDVLLPFEIDTWNTAGESLVWVKLPKLAAKTTKIRMFWRVRDNEDLTDDYMACDVWEANYLGVWHMNKTDTHGQVVDSTANENDLEGAVSWDSSAKCGKGFRATKALQIKKDMSSLGLADSKFTFSGWYRATNYTSGYTNFFGNKIGMTYNATPGWSAYMNNGKSSVGASANNTIQYNGVSDLSANWHRFDYVSPGLANRTFLIDNATVKTLSNIAAVTNENNILVAAVGFSADEVRLSKVKRDASTWLKAEYETATSSSYCSFSLVRRLQDDGTYAWVNYWTTVPTVPRYKEVDTLLTSDIKVGALKAGSVDYTLYIMPEGVVTNFDYVKTTPGPYNVNFHMQANPMTSGSYIGLHVYYDGDRTRELEIIKSQPKPIDPAGEGVDAVNRRVLLANDDLKDGGDTSITNQGYWAWHHEDTKDDLGLILTNNLLKGTKHTLLATNGVDALWVLRNVYMGNILNTNTAAVTFNDAKQRTLPWSSTTLNSTTNAADEAKAFNHTMNGTFVMRNVGGTTNDTAYIESPWYTNGIGTIYFDAVSGYVTNNTTAFTLVVEVSTSRTVSVWQPVTDIQPILYNGGAFTKQTKVETINLNDTTRGTGVSRFYRFCAKVERREGLRFRIRRTGELPDVDAEEGLPDDYHGFIILDNIVASWPKADVTFKPCGWYDKNKTGKQVLGQETSMTVNYPTAHETDLRVRARLTDPASAEYVTSARCYYRWRYLGALFNPEQIIAGSDKVDQWSTSYLDKENDFMALKPLTLDGRVGDIEYYFECTAVVPYYQFVDYAGFDPAKTTAIYSEDVTDHGLTCRRSNEDTTILPSRGTDWFVRLREGASDIAAFKLYVQAITADDWGDPITNIVESDCVLIDDHVWRGFYRTQEAPIDRVIAYRLESLTPVTPGATAANYQTNFWKAGSDFLKKGVTSPIPGSTILAEGGSNVWSKAYCDAATGHLMFQIDDSTKSLTVMHADYQDFNGWSDAVDSTDDPPYFTGSSIENGKKSGVSSKMLRQTQAFQNWEDTPETKDEWQETFRNVLIDVTYPGYTTFRQSTTPNSWTAANGQWVGKFYHPIDLESRTNSQGAVQLNSKEGGYLQILSPGGNPRGIGTVEVTARVAQPIGFDNFNCYYGDGLMGTNYTFLTRATFDRNQNKNFAGSATLSLVALYKPFSGCYEARWEQLKGEVSKAGGFVGPDKKSQRLSLYRWMPGTGGAMEATCLGSITNTFFEIPQSTALSSSKFMPFFISAKTDSNGNTDISVGVLRVNGGKTATEGIPSSPWTALHYIDNTARHPKAGSYGVMAANCEGVFMRPVVYPSKVTVSGATSTVGRFERLDNKAVTFTGTAQETSAGLLGDMWAIDATRLETFYNNSAEYGLKAAAPSVALELYLAKRGTDDFSLFGSRDITSFGTPTKAGETVTFTVRDLEDRAIRIMPSEYDTANLVITGVAFTQWRGDNFGEGDTTGWSGYNDGKGFASNFVFTSGIIQNNRVLLSGRRTKPNVAASVRSPHYDGQLNKDNTQRGLGLGMVSFNYENAQANTIVLVQIATNSDAKAGRDISDLTLSVDSNSWTTVAKYDFSTNSALERRSGVYTVHLGLHGVTGLMRVVLDPAQVAAVQNATDEKAFCEIEITKMTCRDEPALSAADWWGWNLRTVAYNEGNSVQDYLRTYLPDGDINAEATGLALALNNSVVDNVRDADQGDIKVHMPFLQTPTFTNNIVGEVTFRARRYDNGDDAQYAEVQLYGAYTGQEGDDAKWVPLQRFIVTNRYYEAYSFRAAGTYSAFRFAVTGVDGVDYPGVEPLYKPPVRVLIDEVMVFEAVNPSMGFTYVYPFRDDLDKNNVVSNVYDLVTGKALPDAQPLVGENWSVQARIEKRQLPDEIDITTHKPRVLFHWYAGQIPWGYNNWKNQSGAHTAELAVSDEDDLVFRGGLAKARGAIVDATTKDFEVVQYSADVIYHTIGGTELTNSLVLNAATEWVRPDWYAPVDYNAQYAKQGAASAYTILDRIAPGRVWINEVNVFDGMNANWEYFARTNQYVEIAAPELQSLEGWSLEYVNYKYETNSLCTFTSGQTGPGYGPAQKDLKDLTDQQIKAYRTNDYVFIAMQSPATRDAKRWDGVKHAIDGTWKNFDDQGGSLTQYEPIALRLLRPTGVCEEEIAVMGTNYYATGKWADKYSPTNWIAELTKKGIKHNLVYVGNEMGRGLGESLGVVTNTGSVWTEWRNTMKQTPGRVNEGQIVPYGYVLMPNGEWMVLRTRIGDNGHILQTLAEEKDSPNEITMMIKKGGEGTNITYKIKQWWQVGSLTTNGVAVAEAAGQRGTYVYRNAGAGLSNDVTIVINAEPFTELQATYGLTDANRYTKAVMQWLEDGVVYDGTPFKNPGKICLADYRSPYDPNFETNLTLTAMYWLDMDPTVEQSLRAATVDIKPMQTAAGVPFERLKFFMEISNKTTTVTHAPYVLRGVECGSTTADLPAGSVWTSVTFKVTADLQNGVAARTRWVPIRYFTFIPTSFGADHCATIDVWDPKDENTAIWTKGWSAWPNAPVFFSWSVDDRSAPISAENLTPNSTFGL